MDEQENQVVSQLDKDTLPSPAPVFDSFDRSLVGQKLEKMRGFRSTLLLLAVSLLMLMAPRQAAAFLPQERRARLFVAVYAERKPVPTRSQLTPAERLLRKNAEAKGQGGQVEPSTAPFDNVKEAFYSVGDNLGKIKQPKKKVDKVYEGYKGAVKGQSPAQQILQNPLMKLNKTSPKQTPVKKGDPKPSIFDSFKDTIYGTADLVSNKPKKSSSKPKSPIQRISAVGTEEFKPSVAKQRDRVVPESVSLEDLQSDNPLKRTAAELKLRDAELKQNAKQTKQTIENTVDSAKEGVYKASEFFQNTAADIERLPDRGRKLADDVSAFFQAIPGVVEETVDTITAIPTKVEQNLSKTFDKTVKAVDEVKAIPARVQQTAEKTANKAKETVDEVKSIPSKVQQTAENTARTAKTTVDKTVQVVNDVKAFPSKVQQSIADISYNTKVLLGKEKPKPKPPPPPPKDAGEVARRAAGTVAKGVGDAAWFVTKGAAQLGWKAVEAGVDKVQEQLAQQQPNKPSAAVKPPPPPPKPAAKKPPAPPKKEAGPKAEAPKPPPAKETNAVSEKKPEAEAPKPAATTASVEIVEKDLETAELDAEIAEALEAAKSALKPASDDQDSKKKTTD